MVIVSLIAGWAGTAVQVEALAHFARNYAWEIEPGMAAGWDTWAAARDVASEILAEASKAPAEAATALRKALSDSAWDARRAAMGPVACLAEDIVAAHASDPLVAENGGPLESDIEGFHVGDLAQSLREAGLPDDEASAEALLDEVRRALARAEASEREAREADAIVREAPAADE